MASDDLKKNDGNDPGARAEKAVERATTAAEEAHAAENKAADAGREGQYDAQHSSDAGVHEAAHAVAAKAAEAEEAAREARTAADETKQAADRVAELVESGKDGEAADAVGAAETAAGRAEEAARRAAAAADAAARGERAADEAKLEADEKRGYGEEHVRESDVHKERRPALYLAEFDTPGRCMKAAEAVRDAEYEKWDVHTPYPVHGMEKAMGLPETRLGWIAMAAGMLGLLGAVFMIHFMNASDWDLLGFVGYPIVVGGKPPGSFPSMVPIMFELSILLCGFGTLLGMLHLTRLPRHHHAVFESDRFAAASDDKFFISIEAEDPKFDLEGTRQLLESTNPTHVELVEEEVW